MIAACLRLEILIFSGIVSGAYIEGRCGHRPGGFIHYCAGRNIIESTGQAFYWGMFALAVLTWLFAEWKVFKDKQIDFVQSFVIFIGALFLFQLYAIVTVMLLKLAL